MGFKKQVLAVLLGTTATMWTGLVVADEAQTAGEVKVKVEDVKERGNVTPGADVDELITNPMMRAATGSKSRWSFSSALNYNGGSVETPLAENRPNIAATTATITKSLLEGTVSAKYNLNTQNSLSGGLGVRWIAPLQKHVKDNGSRVDASNPYLTYQYLYKWSGIQSAFAVTPTLYTNRNLTREGYVAALGIQQDNVYEIGHTGISLGLFAWFSAGVYNKSGALGNPGDTDYMEDVRADQSDYGGGLDPFMEYQITDKLNLRTVLNLWNYEHIRNEPRAMTFNWDKVYQSVGLGYALTRDIFIYPNVQFLPDNIRAELTNVGLNTNINVF